MVPIETTELAAGLERSEQEYMTSSGTAMAERCGNSMGAEVRYSGRITARELGADEFGLYVKMHGLGTGGLNPAEFKISRR